MNKAANGFVSQLRKNTLSNENFRQVAFTGEKMQVVLMTLKPGEDIGREVHEGHDQFFMIEEGEAEVFIDGETYKIIAGDSAVVPSGADHNLTNIGDNPLKLFTIYAPPEHPEGRVNEEKPVE